MKKFILNEETEIEKEYVYRTKTSRLMDETACQYLPGGSTRSATDSHPHPIYMKRGEGCVLKDVDGNEYIDFMNNYTVLMLGHAYPKINAAMVKQQHKGVLFGSPSQHQFELGRIICERVESVDLVRFSNTGTEAVMYAIRAARAVTGKNKIVKMEGGFHGNTELMEISVAPDITKAGSAQRPIPLPDTQGIPQGVLQDILVVPYNDSTSAEQIIIDNKDEIAAVIIEPVMGYSGMIPAEKAFLQTLREITEKNNIILIFDEIISFRLATGGAQALYGVKPDLTAFGKIIGGGLSIGAFGGKSEIMEIFSPKREDCMHHSGTFNGNAITMAAGIAAMKEIGDELIENINEKGENLRRSLQNLFDDKGIVGKITGIGSLMNVHFSPQDVTNLRTSKENTDCTIPIRDLLNLSLKNHGVYTPRRVMLCISSPMTEKELDQAVNAFEASLDQLKPIIEKKFPELLV